MMKSIGFKLTAIMLSVILLGIAATVGVAAGISSNVITRETLAKIQNNTQSEVRNMDSWLKYQSANITTLADVLSQTDDLSQDNLAPLLLSVMDDNGAYFEVYMGFPDGTATTASGYEYDYSWWHAPERGWYKLALTDTTKAHITSPYLDAQTGELCITAVHAVIHDGELMGVVSADIFVTDLQDMTMAATLDSTGYAMLLGTEGDIIVHPDADYAPIIVGEDAEYRNLGTVMDNAYAELWKQISSSQETIKYRDADGVVNYYTASALSATSWYLVTVLPANVVAQPITNMLLIVIPLALLILILAAILVLLTVRNIITRPISKLVTAADALAAGDTGLHIGSEYQGEMGTLASAFRRITESVDVQVRSAKAIADGDLTTDISVRGERDVMGNALNNLLDSLRTMVSDISGVAVRVSRGSEKIVSDSQALADNSQEQVASMRLLTENADALSDIIVRNAQMAEQAAGLSNSVKENAEKGSMQMTEMLGAVKEINDASKGIEKVMKAIEDIAFQTNILALNAAVEAARAGQHGKGFAVVAEEVRSLAAKSADAAKDTSSLISNSIEKAALGARIAEETSASLRGIVDGIGQSADIVIEIARSGAVQSDSVEEINRGIAQVSEVIRQSSASAGESAAASQEMSGQANVLEELVSQFKLMDGNRVEPSMSRKLLK